MYKQYILEIKMKKKLQWHQRYEILRDKSEERCARWVHCYQSSMLFQALIAKVSLEGTWQHDIFLLNVPWTKLIPWLTFLPDPDRLGWLIQKGNSGPPMSPWEPGSEATPKPSHFPCPGPVPSLLSSAITRPRLETLILDSISILGRPSTHPILHAPYIHLRDLEKDSRTIIPIGGPSSLLETLPENRIRGCRSQWVMTGK